jgi:nitrate/TMAO reductase-like tetraheme cytochrome c subunit
MKASARFSLLRQPRGFFRLSQGQVLVTIGFSWALIGVAGWAGFGMFVEHTSTTEFCMSCHEMKSMQEELSKTVHFRNRTGVRVACGDCHVPQGQLDKLIAKVQALDDVYAHFIGTVDTPEKFEARREEMAHTVWAEMKANGSQACRTCHDFEAMDFSKQSERPRRKHNEAMSNGETCIDCHKGVAHALPRGFRK